VCPHDATPLAEPGDSHSDPLIGAVLAGTYRITSVVGEGGMARLYAAEHLRLDARYAVKVIHDDLAKSPELLARFEREARAAARIRTDHIVRVIDVLQTPDNRPCIVTELLEGEDLQDRLDRVGRLKPGRAIPIARQICRALVVAHEAGVVHRDLKPSNVFLCRDGDELIVKVLDFGVAKLDDKSELTKTGAIVGTLAYMAPEQARRAADAGPLADIYQVGAALYHMLTGQPPYGKDPAINPLVLLLGGPPNSPRSIEASIPIGVEAVIERAMAREPEQRPQSARALDEELAAFDGEIAPATADSRELEPARSPDGSGAPPPAAARISAEARRARPGALLLSGAAILVVGLWAASLLASLVTSEVEARTTAERTLIVLVAVGASVGIGAALTRALRQRWRSPPAIQQTGRMLRRGLLAGLVTFAALELAALGAAAASMEPVGFSAGGWALRLIAAGLAAVAGMAWPRLRRYPLVRRFTA
jgi:serine/threonine-protein kinase